MKKKIYMILNNTFMQNFNASASAQRSFFSLLLSVAQC